MDIEIKDGGTYRIYPIRLQGVALNAYGSSATTSGQNVCLYKDTPSDTMQDWIIRVFDIDEGSYRIYSANNTNLVLDRSDGSLRTSRNNNAHLCKLTGTSPKDSEVMITTPAGDSQGHVFIKLKAAINGQVLYLTSTNYSSSDSTPSSITSSMALNTNGNVYWAPQSSETRAYQYWRLEKQGDSGETPPPDPEPEPTEEVTVTNMPANVYGQKPGEEEIKDKEFFHPKSGMRNGTWAANGGADIEQKMRNYYYTVYKTYPVSNSQYLYNLYGARLIGYNTYHLGVDICHGQGSPIYSAHSGEVIYINAEKGQVAIYDGTYTYYYLHMTDINVSLNETVTAGVTNIGKEGDQGWANGFHVHLEIFRGKHATGAVNPVLVNQDLPTVCPYNLI